MTYPSSRPLRGLLALGLIGVAALAGCGRGGGATSADGEVRGLPAPGAVVLSAEPRCVKPGGVVTIAVQQRDDRFQPGEDGWLVDPGGGEWKDAMIPAHARVPHEPYRNADPAKEIRPGYGVPGTEQRWSWKRHLIVGRDLGSGEFSFVWAFHDSATDDPRSVATHEAKVGFQVSSDCPPR